MNIPVTVSVFGGFPGYFTGPFGIGRQTVSEAIQPYLRVTSLLFWLFYFLTGVVQIHSPRPFFLEILFRYLHPFSTPVAQAAFGLECQGVR